MRQGLRVATSNHLPAWSGVLHMDPQPAMSLPGKGLQQTVNQFDHGLNRSNRVKLATNDLKNESVKFLEATYLLTKEWFGFDITREELKAQVQALKPAITLDP